MTMGGVPVVNRLNTLQNKFFMRNEGPNFRDHDCRSGKMTEPNGYQLLTTKPESEVVSARAEAAYSSPEEDLDFSLSEENDGVESTSENANHSLAHGDSEQDPDSSNSDTPCLKSQSEDVPDLPYEDTFFADYALIHNNNNPASSPPAAADSVGTDFDNNVYTEQEKEIDSLNRCLNDIVKRTREQSKNLGKSDAPCSQENTKLSTLANDWTSEDEEEISQRNMHQLDGINDGSSSDSELDSDFSFSPKRRRLELPNRESSTSSESGDSLSSENEDEERFVNHQDSRNEEPDSDENEDEEAEEQMESLTEFLENLPSSKVTEDELGRPHIKCPTTGKTYLFFKSCQFKSASISRHCNDIINIAEVNTQLKPMQF